MNENVTTAITKLKDSELAEFKDLQLKFQRNYIDFGLLAVDKIEIETSFKDALKREKELIESRAALQASEKALIEKISTTYGEGNLNLVNGTFTPSIKK